VEPVNDDGRVGQRLLHRCAVALPHVGTHRRDGRLSVDWQCLQPGHDRDLQAVWQHGEQVERAIDRMPGQDGDNVPVAFGTRNRVDSEHGQRRQRRPIDGRSDPAVEDLRQANLLGPLVLLQQASPCARLQ
jgi:hypothetical protein